MKVETFGDSEKGGELKLGLHRPNHFYEIVETPECNIVPNDFNLLRKEIQSFFIEKGISYYHRAKKEGTLRHCVLRASITKKEFDFFYEELIRIFNNQNFNIDFNVLNKL